MKVTLSRKDVIEAVGDWLASNKNLDIIDETLTLDDILNEITVEVDD